jgi:small nuclear ribonucleoprotein (snRNP)-like protein
MMANILLESLNQKFLIVILDGTILKGIQESFDPENKIISLRRSNNTTIYIPLSSIKYFEIIR